MLSDAIYSSLFAGASTLSTHTPPWAHIRTHLHIRLGTPRHTPIYFPTLKSDRHTDMHRYFPKHKHIGTHMQTLRDRLAPLYTCTLTYTQTHVHKLHVCFNAFTGIQLLGRNSNPSALSALHENFISLLFAGPLPYFPLKLGSYRSEEVKLPNSHTTGAWAGGV